ncbi:MAG: glycosyltransferase family 39 protein [Pontiellaceae bacterium]|nr:glycosyltransferase family 39 protein [Pontiellaceae bacterium]MBN2784551.1 glycosyltransferase family 39 protein [Pontiellaceae bacterium]
MSKLNDILDNPKKALTIWSAYHLIVWTFLPWLCNSCLPLDSIEAVMWGSQWQWGYDKHPPLSAWTPELMTDLMGDGGLYLLSQLCVVIAGLGIYRLGRRLNLSARQSLVAVLLLDTIYYYQFISVEFNVNILQMPLWAWGWYFGIDAVSRKKYGSWIGLGICIALGALTKYIAVFLLAPLFAAWWQRGELKKALTSPGLYLAGILSILVFLPHLIWMKNHDWITITYGLRRGAEEETLWWHHLWNPLEFLLTQAAILAPVIIVAVIGKVRNRTSSPPGKDGAMGLALGAFLAIALLSLATGMAPVTMWAAPMPLAVGLWLVPRFELDRIPRTLLTSMVVMSSVFVIGYGVTYGLGPKMRDKPHRVNYPGKALAAAVEERWHEKQNAPLQYVIGDEFLGGIVNHYGADEPAVMIRGDLERSAYLTEEQVRKNGAMVIWLKNRNAEQEQQVSLQWAFPDLPERYSSLKELPDLIIPWPRNSSGLAGRYGIAYIPPSN